MDLVKIEKDISDTWVLLDTPEEVREAHANQPLFTSVDGPPFATGSPHFGHLLVSTIKDTITRFQTMNGFYAPRSWGWDCHGVPIENLVQSEMKMSRSEIISQNKVGDFNAACKRQVLRCENQWEETIERLGRWTDFSTAWKTMSKSYMEAVWHIFAQLYRQDRIYQAKRVLPYSPGLQTTLSNHEADHYRQVSSPAIIVKFKAVNESWFFLAYTTTPWTILTNAALCLHPEEMYSLVFDHAAGEGYVVSNNLIPQLFKGKEIVVRWTLPGSSLRGTPYSPPFGGEGKILTDPFVSSKEGTGIVHLSPAFGEDDFRVCSPHKIPVIDLLDPSCAFQELPQVPPSIRGIFCKDADPLMIKHLSEMKAIFSESTIEHSYPYCERSNTPLIYRAVDAWYLRIEDIKSRMVELNKGITWVQSVGACRFNNWLLDAKDWNISRNRLFGACLPIWRSESGNTICIRSPKELDSFCGKELHLTDLHKDTLDQITFTLAGETYRRVPEVLDCWFESGCAPYAQYGYPYAAKEIEDRLPVDLIVEGLDQTRGWFYSLLVIGTLLFNKAPMKTILVNGLILSEDGTKMSKSKSNYSDPLALINKHGADALRAYLLSSPAVHGEPLQFKEEEMVKFARGITEPFNNALSFFKMYSRLDDWEPITERFTAHRLLDQWILAEFSLLSSNVSSFMEDFNLAPVLPEVVEFLDKLCNWYIRLSRPVFWGNLTEIKKGAYGTLYCVLYNLSKLLAPFLPHVSEFWFSELGNYTSVHLESFPKPESKLTETAQDASLIERMEIVRSLAAMGHSIRVKNSLPIKQPLATAFVSTVLSPDERELLAQELNVKEVLFSVYQQKSSLSAKANFKRLGSRLGKDMKDVAVMIERLSSKELEEFRGMTIMGYPLSVDDLIITSPSIDDKSVSSKDGLSIRLDTELNASLRQERDFRDMVSAIQKARKELGLSISDRIKILWSAYGVTAQLFMTEFENKLRKMTLAVSVDQEPLEHIQGLIDHPLPEDPTGKKIDLDLPAVGEMTAYIYKVANG